MLLLLLLQVRIMYCEMLGHDVGFAYIPVLQMASDPNLLNKKVGCCTRQVGYGTVQCS
jgi:hypothetical protein